MFTFLKRFDWILIGSLVPLFVWSLLTLKSVGGGADDSFFYRQLTWIGVGFLVMFLMACIEWRFFARSGVVLILYGGVISLLLFLFIVGTRIKGAQSWFSFSVASFQPAEIMKLVLIVLLAKYYSYRHIDIARIRHIFITASYTAFPFILILLQPDLGSALIIFAIWVGMTMVAGIRMRHFLMLTAAGVVSIVLAWMYVLAPYQHQRILTFLNPAADPQGTGYNALQSVIAVGSGQFLGKGVGYGSQSRLQFLPEARTDFIFAAFAEEWGFMGVLLLLTCLGVFLWRVLTIGASSPTNFSKLFAIGFSILVVVQGVIHAGMNMGVLPITGITFPFMSYGGSSLLALFVGVGMLQNMYIHRSLFYSSYIDIGDSSGT
ncbi:MAG: rod shape-determining protein RodA [Candidatus Ryanbacteria bacterium RIFCSPHIGHO2_02_FULL_45_13b]|uniref:Rod shape-determining protein RodA n=1 Tax=Candidatus Ryanbacteria bacterium RIFCSPHIGHO2_02_FULL_45_13b TaxID=1802117 RepID=A0A1G2GA47_9BACT|nr:MAG: rod shape-determining protein RodA [Candidatus Ryanbacteria bacterium RIFCSPHIGHO2_02_FULL_45_13b]